MTTAVRGNTKQSSRIGPELRNDGWSVAQRNAPIVTHSVENTTRSTAGGILTALILRVLFIGQPDVCEQPAGDGDRDRTPAKCDDAVRNGHVSRFQPRRSSAARRRRPSRCGRRLVLRRVAAGTFRVVGIAGTPARVG